MLLRSIEENIELTTKKKNKVCNSIYRPFYKQKFYYDKDVIQRTYQIPKLFPHPSFSNLLICVSGIGVTKDFSALITDIIPDLEFVGKNQCFPLYYYEEKNDAVKTLYSREQEGEYIRKDGISDFILEQAQKQYGLAPGEITKEDIFYYVYGFLHSPEYRAAFASELKRSLPRLPLAEAIQDFWAFSQAGRELVYLHLNYEKVPPHPQVEVKGEEKGDYTVKKMRFAARDQKDTIIYNSYITVSNIPAKAYEYVVNGKSAIEWVIERYQVTTHKESRIINNPNDWAKECGNPRYILDLLLSVIHVSTQTMEIVERLPKLDFREEEAV